MPVLTSISLVASIIMCLTEGHKTYDLSVFFVGKVIAFNNEPILKINRQTYGDHSALSLGHQANIALLVSNNPSGNSHFNKCVSLS